MGWICKTQLSEKQYLALTQKKDYSLFTRIVGAELKRGKDGDFELNLDSVNLFASENLKDKWRTFTKITLDDASFTESMHQVFTKMLKPKVADCIQSSNPYSNWKSPENKLNTSAVESATVITTTTSKL